MGVGLHTDLAASGSTVCLKVGSHCRSLQIMFPNL